MSEVLLGQPHAEIVARLQSFRAQDAPTHGGKLFSYVYDSGLLELDDLAAEAAVMALPVNGLDPTAFSSVPAMEKELIAFAKRIFNARGFSKQVQGTVTSGGTESCMLAVKTARDLWRDKNSVSETIRPRIVAPVTAHAAFQKAAHYFGLEFDAVPVSVDGVVDAKDIISRLDADVALVVVSAPSYPTAQLDPIVPVAQAAKGLGISCHVDACIGGFALPWWHGVQAFDFRVPGVTSLSADLHKFGYAPKGASLLLQKGKARHRKQFFATKRWPGYPVVNPTMLGSRSATGLAAAWAIANRLGFAGYSELTHKTQKATQQIISQVQDIPGLRVMGNPTGPLLAICADEGVPSDIQVDPHHLADKLAELGFLVQHQPGLTQTNGVRVPHSVHLTITPVTYSNISEFVEALETAAGEVRGRSRANPRFELSALKALGLLKPDAQISQKLASFLLKVMGVGAGSNALPSKMAPLMRIIEELPAEVAETLLVEVLAQLNQ